MSKLLRPSRAIRAALTCEQDINKQARQAHSLSIKQGTHSYIHTYIHTCIGPTKKIIFLPSILLLNIHPQCYFCTYYIRIPFNTILNTYLHTYIHTYIHTHIHLYIHIHAGNIIHAHQFLQNC
jgi:hypothetical protein